MEPTAERKHEIDHDRLRHARGLTPDERFRAGPELFEMACQLAMAGIRHQHPEASDEEVREILRQRLAQRRERERRP